MAINKVEAFGETLIDLTADTVTPADVMADTTFHSADGEERIGTFSLDDELAEQDSIIEELLGELADKTLSDVAVYEDGNGYVVVDAITGLGGGNESEYFSSSFSKSVDFTSSEDCSSFSFSNDDNGLPLRFTEAVVAVSTTRASSMTQNSSYCVGIIPWSSSYNSKAALHGLNLFSDCYTSIVHIKKIGPFVSANVLWQARTGANSSAIKGVEDLFSSSAFAAAQSSTTAIPYSAFTAKGATPVFDSDGMMNCITVGCDMAVQSMTSGTRIEVWTR